MHMRGVRTRLGGTDWDDYDSDTKQGFSHIESDEIIDIGLSGIVNQSTSSWGYTYIYISVGIDVLDTSNAPGTGALEFGGWYKRINPNNKTFRQFKDSRHRDCWNESLKGLPNSEIIALAASQIAYETVTSLVQSGPLDLKSRVHIRTVNAKENPKYFMLMT